MIVINPPAPTTGLALRSKSPSLMVVEEALLTADVFYALRGEPDAVSISHPYEFYLPDIDIAIAVRLGRPDMADMTDSVRSLETGTFEHWVIDGVEGRDELTAYLRTLPKLTGPTRYIRMP